MEQGYLKKYVKVREPKRGRGLERKNICGLWTLPRKE